MNRSGRPRSPRDAVAALGAMIAVGAVTGPAAADGTRVRIDPTPTVSTPGVAGAATSGTLAGDLERIGARADGRPAAAPFADGLQAAELRNARGLFRSDTTLGETLLWAAGIGGGAGLAYGAIRGKDAGQAALEGAGTGVGVLVLVMATAASVMPVAPPGSPGPAGVTGARLGSPRMPGIELPLSGPGGRGRARHALRLGAGAGLDLRLSWVKTW